MVRHHWRRCSGQFAFTEAAQRGTSCSDLCITRSRKGFLAAGPTPNNDTATIEGNSFSGSVMIVDFPDLTAAKKWAADDPYTKGGVFETVSVKPFIKVLP